MIVRSEGPDPHAPRASPRIALVQTYHPYTQFTHVHPLGIMMIAAQARAAGFADVHILDMKVEDWTPERCADELARLDPDVVGLSAMTYEAGCMHALAKLVKQRLPHAKVVCGGPHPSVAAADVLQDASVDFVVRGEGEFTFAELLERLREGRGDWSDCAGLSWRDASGVVHSLSSPLLPLLSRAPPPSRSHPKTPHARFRRAAPESSVWSRAALRAAQLSPTLRASTPWLPLVRPRSTAPPAPSVMLATQSPAPCPSAPRSPSPSRSTLQHQPTPPASPPSNNSPAGARSSTAEPSTAGPSPARTPPPPTPSPPRSSTAGSSPLHPPAPPCTSRSPTPTARSSATTAAGTTPPSTATTSASRSKA